MPVYSVSGEHVLDMDLVGVDLFGVVTYGVHLTAYVMTPEGRKYWVPRRSRTKFSYPGRLDNAVAGNIRTGERALDRIVERAASEASIPKEFTRANIRACGTVSYQMSTTNFGQPGCQHHVQYVYEMELPQHLVPVPNRGETDAFNLMSLDEVRRALARGEFKPNTGMTWLAYFVRHGIVDSENEADLVEICARLHRKHDLFIA
jgi:isopentenyldiphosphate isomerase